MPSRIARSGKVVGVHLSERCKVIRSDCVPRHSLRVLLLCAALTALPSPGIAAVCGNGIVEAGEQCDDGGVVDGDGCSSGCLLEGCPPGLTGTWTSFIQAIDMRWSIVEGAGGALSGGFYLPEDPDNSLIGEFTGTRNGTAVTLSRGECGGTPDTATWTDCDTLVLNVCGNINNAGTLTRLSTAACGNGLVEAEEECDDGNFANVDGCNVTCTVPRCGDAILEPGEECDDGNLVSGDGCSAVCTLQVCGNTVVELGEECDDGNLLNGDGCSDRCRLQTCGNGIVEAGEQCDDGDVVDGDGCSSGCLLDGCAPGLTGTWISNIAAIDVRWTIVEGAGGALSGGFYFPEDPDNSLIGDFTGTRSGTAVTLSAGVFCDDPPTSTGTWTGCDTLAMYDCGNFHSPYTLTRISTVACGNGLVEAGEECDDGNFANIDGCNVTCTLPRCGDAILEPDEECDDGNLLSGDGCSAACTLQVCGNTVVELGEDCDDGNLLNGDGCSDHCRLQTCGNGIVEAGEQCDDGNVVDGDGCSGGCLLDGCPPGLTGTWFGNISAIDVRWNIVEGAAGALSGSFHFPWDPGNAPSGEFTGTRSGAAVTLSAGVFCDDPPTSMGTWTACDTLAMYDCGNFHRPYTIIRLSPVACGDGLVEAGEDCDDGNTISTDACTIICTVNTCGDGVVHTGVEACDDGNPIETDTCKSDCTLSLCGDGVVHAGVEVCDDGGESLTCDLDCTAAVCGDQTVNATAGEECDDGNSNNNDACKSDCALNVCGDGFIDVGVELCDDGNTSSGDACKNDCTLNVCGDGFVNVGVEACDDGNSNDNDACKNNCSANLCGDGVLYIGVEACDAGGESASCDLDCTFATCGDQALNTTAGEQCDDGNAADGDGCSATCGEQAAPESIADASASPSAPATTDDEGDGATPADPVETTVTPPGSVTISIIETSDPGGASEGLQFLNQQVSIAVSCDSPPCATAMAPVRFVFRIDASRVPAGQDVNTIQVLKNGDLVPNCDDASGTAAPDPCVFARTLLPDGDVELSVLSSTASTWTFGVVPATQLVRGKKLLIKDQAEPARRKLLLVSRDSNIGAAVPDTAGDPRCTAPGGGGGRIEVMSTGGSEESVVIALPCSNWQISGEPAALKGYRYKDPEQDEGPCMLVRLKRGKLLKVLCTGKNLAQPLSYDLTASGEGSVGVRLETGTGALKYCAEFGGGTVKQDDEQQFRGQDAGAPPACPTAP